MSEKGRGQKSCAVCSKSFRERDLVPGVLVRDVIGDLIAKDHPQWSADSLICRADLAQYRSYYVRSILETEKGELTSLEEEVLESLHQHDLLATDIETEFERERTIAERLSDGMAAFGGSWKFLILFGVFMVLWIAMNSIVLWRHPVDPYPFILLNLLLSCLAAIQAPIIMMSQNRQEEKDRLRSQHDYQVNLKAELEIRHLHEKIDHLLSHQWERLVEIQQIQLELLSELGRNR